MYQKWCSEICFKKKKKSKIIKRKKWCLKFVYRDSWYPLVWNLPYLRLLFVRNISELNKWSSLIYKKKSKFQLEGLQGTNKWRKWNVKDDHPNFLSNKTSIERERSRCTQRKLISVSKLAFVYTFVELKILEYSFWTRKRLIHIYSMCVLGSLLETLFKNVHKKERI